jgi:hypothetical protein
MHDIVAIVACATRICQVDLYDPTRRVQVERRSVNVLNMMKTVDHPLNGTGVQQAQKLQQDWSNFDRF